MYVTLPPFSCVNDMLLAVVLRSIAAPNCKRITGVTETLFAGAGTELADQPLAPGGALGGLAGASQVLGLEHNLKASFSAGYGFDSIAIECSCTSDGSLANVVSRRTRTCSPDAICFNAGCSAARSTLSISMIASSG